MSDPPPGYEPPPGYGAPPPGYQQPPPPGYGYGYPQPPSTETSAVVALVLSIISFVFCPIVPALAALVVANSAEASIAASGGRKTGEGLARAARIISWVHLGLVLVGLALAVIVGLVLIATD